MFILDTNVLSEIMREVPDPRVADWLRGCPIAAMFTTAISETEILYGVRCLPDGQRRSRLVAAARELFASTFAERVLAFDAAAADRCADIRIASERSGKPIGREDGMIAAIAHAKGATIVTRDRDFAGCGVPVVNPWVVGTEE